MIITRLWVEFFIKLKWKKVDSFLTFCYHFKDFEFSEFKDTHFQDNGCFQANKAWVNLINFDDQKEKLFGNGHVLIGLDISLITIKLVYVLYTRLGFDKMFLLDAHVFYNDAH